LGVGKNGARFEGRENREFGAGNWKKWCVGRENQLRITIEFINPEIL